MKEAIEITDEQASEFYEQNQDETFYHFGFHYEFLNTNMLESIETIDDTDLRSYLPIKTLIWRQNNRVLNHSEKVEYVKSNYTSLLEN